MALIINGVVTYDELGPGACIHGNSRLGRLYKELGEYEQFFLNGTKLSHLSGAMRKAFPGKLELIATTKKGSDLRPFIEEHILQNHPVILGLTWEDTGHWVLVIGIEYQYNSGYNERQLCRFLVLEPSDPPSTVCAWNDVIDARGSGGIYPYTWWTREEKVQFEYALAIG